MPPAFPSKPKIESSAKRSRRVYNDKPPQWKAPMGRVDRDGSRS